MTPKRAAKFRKVVKQRQANLTVVLENVHDPHNIGAVLRTCDSVGIKEIFVLYTDVNLDYDRLALGHNAASGAKKWVDVNFYTNLEACFRHIKKDYDNIYSTHLASDSKSLYQLELTESVALLFGNERDGLSKEALEMSDGNFIIPQMGMVQSLNISVACAVSLYEALRQRTTKGFYTDHPTLSAEEQDRLFKLYEQRHDEKYKVNSAKRID